MNRNGMRMSATARPPVTTARGRPGDRLLPGPDISKDTCFFAKLSINELRTDLSTLINRSVTADELKAPTSDLVREVLGFFIDDMHNRSADSMSQSEFGCMEQLDFPELLEDHAIAQVTVLRYARRLFVASEYDQFGLRDLHSPDRPRFQMQASALVNLWRFKSSRYQVFKELCTSTDEGAALQKQLLEQTEALKRQVDEIQSVRALEEADLAQIREKIEENEVNLNTFHKEQATLTEKTHERKKKIAQFMGQLEAIQLKCARERDEVRRMQSKVVISPDRVKAEYNAMDEKLESDRTYVSSMRLRTCEIIARDAALTKVAAKGELLKNTNKDVVEKIKLRKKLEQGIENATTKKSEFEAELKAHTQSKALHERQMASLSTKIARVHEQHSEVMNRSTASDRELEKDDQYVATIKEKCAARDDNIQLAENLRKEIVKMSEDYRDEISQVRAKQHMLWEKMDDFSRDTTEVMGIYMSTNDTALQDYEKLVSSA